MARILLTRAQAAATLGVRPKQIDDWRENMDLPCSTNKFNSRRSYPEAAVKKWAKAHGKPVYEIKDQKRSLRDLYGHPGLFPDATYDGDGYPYPTGIKCPTCDEELFSNGKGEFKCPTGCKVPTIKCPKCGRRFRLLADPDTWKCLRCVDDSIRIEYSE